MRYIVDGKPYKNEVYDTDGKKTFSKIMSEMNALSYIIESIVIENVHITKNFNEVFDCLMLKTDSIDIICKRTVEPSAVYFRDFTYGVEALNSETKLLAKRFYTIADSKIWEDLIAYFDKIGSLITTYDKLRAVIESTGMQNMHMDEKTLTLEMAQISQELVLLQDAIVKKDTIIVGDVLTWHFVKLFTRISGIAKSFGLDKEGDSDASRQH